MSLPRKAVFAPTQTQARALARAFGLEPDDWSSFSFGTATMGRQFDRIVVHVPVNPSSHDVNYIATLRTRLAEKGAFEVISPVLSASQIDPPAAAI